MDKRSTLRLKPGAEIIFTNHRNMSVAVQTRMPMRRGRVKWVTPKGGVLVVELAYRHPHTELGETWLPYHHIVQRIPIATP